MVAIEMPVLEDHYEETLEKRLDEKGPVVRFQNLVEDDSLAVRQALDELVLNGTAARIPVGDHIVIRDLRGDPERSKGWPHETPD